MRKATVTPLYVAKIKSGVVDYRSCRTGNHYLIEPHDGGFALTCKEADLTVWTPSRRQALHLIEIIELARLAKKEGEPCLLLTG